MDMLNRLKSTVGGLIGNPVTREFDVGPHIASAGPGHLWRIYEGTKKTTKQKVSLFYLEKKYLDKFSRKDREKLLETLKIGPTKLTKLRHPNLLVVEHPLEESRESLAFATEPVFASLSNLLGCREGMPSPVPQVVTDHELYEVEIKYGLLQLTEALKFLHNNVKMIHGNICPENVILNANGAWKLAGFDFFIQSSNPPDQPVSKSKMHTVLLYIYM
ncbi:SCY1-like protein 2 [Holothuria leucospilota]|uniref:SCY1-like protein 2 n=1 Tax=Holothuria leucospilota TaxID=206669 RepID=A0A9Q0YCI0_HOLLE|nr:SCY1-like protein 2 [Holothuria leucospilota]